MDPIDTRVHADHIRRSTEHITLGFLARHLTQIEAILGPLHASDLRVHPHAQPERTRVTLRCGTYHVTLHDETARAGGVNAPFVIQDDVPYTITRPADLKGRHDTTDDTGLRLTPAAAQTIHRLARPQITTSMLLSATGIFICGVASIILAFAGQDDANGLSTVTLTIAALGALGITWDIIRNERLRRTPASFQSGNAVPPPPPPP